MANFENPKAISLQRLRNLSNLLDNAIPIPGTDYRIGIDPILGLIPGGGDTIAAVLSAYIVIEAARLGLPRESLIRMVFNLIVDTALGSLPFLGDIFDATWKANIKNLALIESHLALPQKSKKVDRVFLIFLIIALMLIVMTVTFISVVLFKLILGLVNGN
ncbi:MAG TPA: DUF4112 domain-containing protein [Leptolyngbyaceae cyanobacterium]